MSHYIYPITNRIEKIFHQYFLAIDCIISIKGMFYYPLWWWDIYNNYINQKWQSFVAKIWLCYLVLLIWIAWNLSWEGWSNHEFYFLLWEGFGVCHTLMWERWQWNCISRVIFPCIPYCSQLEHFFKIIVGWLLVWVIIRVRKKLIEWYIVLGKYMRDCWVILCEFVVCEWFWRHVLRERCVIWCIWLTRLV